MEFHPMLTLFFTCIISIITVRSGPVLPDLSSYNPLEEGFTVQDGWKHYTTPHTTVVGSAADLKKGDNCQRVIAFSAEGAVLDYHRTNCDSLDPRLGLLEAFGAIWYYKDVLARQVSEGKYTILFRTKEKTCKEKTYIIKTCSNCGSPFAEENTEASVNINNDNYCNLLAHFIEPMMKFLSSHSTLGTSSPVSEWADYNIWEPLGAMFRIYDVGQMKIFRLMVVTSHGRVVEKLKVSGGPMQGFVLTDKALYYGNVVMVKPQGADMNTFTVLLNPNSGVCVKRTITLSNNNGGISRSRTKPEYIQESEPECQNLINRQVPDATVPEDQLVKLRVKLADGDIDVKPFENGLSLQQKEQMPGWNDINLNQELGALILMYNPANGKPVKGEHLCQIIMTAKGVPLAGILKGDDPSKIVARKDHLYHDTDIMVQKGEEGNTFIVITKLNDNSCSKKTFILKNESGKMVKEEKPEVKKTKDDQECKDLIEGYKLTNNLEVEKHGVVVDEFRLIASVNEEVKSASADPEDKDL